MIRIFVLLTVAVAVGLGTGLWVSAGRAAGPSIEIAQPTRFVGRSAVFEATVEAPNGDVTRIDAVVEQDGTSYPLFSLSSPADAEFHQETTDLLRITRVFDRESHPDLHPGSARVLVSATRPVLFGLRERTTETAIVVEIRLDPPRLSPLSNFHYINHGGSELIVYRVTPDDADSGVQVGNRFYPGYAASGAGLTGDTSLRVAFFALLHDQDLLTPITLYARDPAGNEAHADFEHRIFPRSFRRSRLAVSPGFLRRVVPSIAARAPDLADEDINGSATDKDLLDLYLFINGELRRRNSETITALAAETATQWLWDGPFRQLTNSQVESAFADHRTYVYNGEEVDQQMHLGFDLASTANAPIRAANRGIIVYADYLGIFGNCVVIDHGMGLQSLYGHLSSIEVTLGAEVERDQQIGLSGQTGLAGGDHLHFSMLLEGHPVTPLEWWDPHWIEDRVLRKLREAPSPSGRSK